MFFSTFADRPQFEEMKRFVDEHRHTYGVEPICRILQIAPSCYWCHAARQRDPRLCSKRAKRDEVLMTHIQRVFDENWQIYGTCKIWLELHRQGIQVARYIVARLMRHMAHGPARSAPERTDAHHRA